MRRLTAADYRMMPWKNGLGQTTELYRVEDKGGQMLWRVSIAGVAQDGPFSHFPGYDRHIMALSGNGMVLDGGPAGPIPVAGEPVRFSGDWSIVARLTGGPLTDFNLIARRDRLESEMRVESFDAPVQLIPGHADVLVYVLSSGVQAGAVAAAEGEALLLDPGESLELAPLAGHARIIICRVAPRA